MCACDGAAVCCDECLPPSPHSVCLIRFASLCHSRCPTHNISLSCVQVDRISIEAPFCLVFNDCEHRPADGQPPEVEAVLARRNKLEHLQRNIECIVLRQANRNARSKSTCAKMATINSVQSKQMSSSRALVLHCTQSNLVHYP